MSLTEFDQEEYDRHRKEEGFAEGLVKGKLEGLAEGKLEGLAEGELRGINKGAEQTKLETAQNLLKLNILTEEQIAISTSLPLEKIQQIKQELN